MGRTCVNSPFAYGKKRPRSDQWGWGAPSWPRRRLSSGWMEMNKFPFVWPLALLSCSPAQTREEALYSIPDLSFYLTVNETLTVCESVSGGSVHGYIILLDHGVTCSSDPSNVMRYISINAHYNSSEVQNLESDMKGLCTETRRVKVTLKNRYFTNHILCAERSQYGIDYYILATSKSDTLEYSDIIYYFNLHTLSNHLPEDLSILKKIYYRFRLEKRAI